MSKEALKLALAALECKDGWGSSIRSQKDRAITAIKQALEQPVQEPDYEAMWHKVWPDVGSFVRASADDLKKFAKAVSTPPAQRQWVGLTKQEIAIQVSYDCTLEDMVRSVEAKLKEKNT